MPHFDSGETIQHIVFRTFGSIPSSLMALLDSNSARRRTQVDQFLDQMQGAIPLANEAFAEMVQNCLMFFDGKRYKLLGWCVMPNHVHVMIEQMEPHSLGDIVKSWKGESTRAINALGGTRGQFWALDYFDRYIRDELHFTVTLDYIENNPVKAGLAAKASDWRFSSATIRHNLDREPVVRR